MGLMDNIRGFFSGSRNNQPAQPQVNEEYEKSRLADGIVGMVERIQRINSFDSSVWNLSHTSSYELRRRSLSELQSLHSSLQNRLTQLDRESKKRNPRAEELEASKWTGQKPRGMSDYEFDRFQRSDDGAR